MGTRKEHDDKLVLVDCGWPNSGYQYWKNIEAMGHDPRDIDLVIFYVAAGAAGVILITVAIWFERRSRGDQASSARMRDLR